MIDVWLPAVLPTAIAIALLVLPGLAVVWAGWGLRRIGPVLTAPAISVSLMAGTAVVAPMIHVGWGLPVVAGATAIASAAAYLIGRRVRVASPTPPRAMRWALIALVVVAAIMLAQFAYAFVSPESIAQRFDNIVHLNAVQYAVLTSDASAFHIGDTSDISFYPNGWHSVASLTAIISGVDIPTAVNATNLAIVAVAWPFANVALASALFRDRTVALVSSAVLSTGFGAFPALFFDWGVLYPNALGYSLVPAALACFVWLLRAPPGRERIRDGLVLLLITAGVTLSHPNALIALVLFGTLLGGGLLIVEARESDGRRSWVPLALVLGGGAVASAILWTFARTGAAHAVWLPIQSVPQAIGAGLVVSPRGEVPTLALVVLLVCGFVTAARAPRWIPVTLPFLAALALYVIVSGFPVDHPVRQALTNPWYQDWNRLVAMLPMTVIPIMTLGAVAVADAGRALLRHDRLSSRPARTTAGALLGVAAVLAVVTIPTGSSVRGLLDGVRAAYSDGPGYTIVSADERALLERLDEHVPVDALILGSPRTGASLAYAIAGRHVTEMHIFGTRSDDEKFLQQHLRDIEDDPRVCAAIDRVGADFVLDFGSYDVSGDDDPREYSGMVDLQASEHLRLVDEQGDARLFEIVGCAA